MRISVYSSWQVFFTVFIIFLPFQFALSPVEGIDLAIVRVVIIGAFLWWLIQSFQEKKVIFPAPIFSISVGALLLMAGLSAYAVADNQEWAFRKFVFLLSVFPLYFVLVSLLHQKKVSASSLIRAIIVSGTIIALVGIAQFTLQFFIGLDPALNIWRLSIAPFFLGHTFSESVVEFSSWLVNLSGYTAFRAIAFFPDPHMLSFFLELCLPWSVILFFKERKNVYALTSIIILVAILLTFSRGAYLGLVFGFVLGFGYLIATKRMVWKRQYSKIVPLLIFLIGLFAVVLLVENPIKDRFISSFDIYEGSNEGRLYMWSEAYRISKENVLSGVGLGNYPLEIKPSADYREPIYAHNFYLDILVEMGIIALAAWLMWTIVSMKSFIKKAEKNRLYLGGFFALSIFSVHIFFDTPLFSVHILPLVLLVLALSMEDNEQIT